MIAGVLLCAGFSRRFGPADKLLAPLAGMPLVAHAAQRLMRFEARYAVLPAGPTPLARLPELAPFAPVPNPDRAAGRDSSIRAGLGAALAGGATRIVIALGDMPHVSERLLTALVAALDTRPAALASGPGWLSPPLALTAAAARSVLDGERSVRAAVLSLDPALVAAEAAELRDYDLAEDFAAWAPASRPASEPVGQAAARRFSVEEKYRQSPS